MKRFVEVMIRELRLFASNGVAVFIFLAAPIGYGLVVGATYQSGMLKELPVMIVDLDNSPLSNRTIDAIGDNKYLQVREISHTDVNVKQKVIEEDLIAAVHLPSNFEADVYQRRHPVIRVELNGNNMVESNYAGNGLQSTLATLNAGLEIEALKKQGQPEAISREQFEMFGISYKRFFNPANNYMQFIWPGIMGTVMQQVLLIVLALAFSKEFEEGTFSQLLGYSRSATWLILAKGLPYLVLTLLMWVLIFKGFYPLFHVIQPASFWTNWFMILLFSTAYLFLGIMVSIWIPSQLKTTEILMAISLPTFILSGFTWPPSGMPGWVTALADTLPLTHYLHAFRKIQLNGATLSTVSTEMWTLIGMTLLFFMISVWSLKFKINNSLSQT